MKINMNKLLLPLILLFAIACSQEDSENTAHALDFSFDLDTVMVDPGDEIIYLGYGLHTSALSKDQKYLYNFNMDEHLVEVIDLDELVLKERIPFEKEGPNGTGASWVADFNIMEGTSFW
jgi:plastocyanin